MRKESGGVGRAPRIPRVVGRAAQRLGRDTGSQGGVGGSPEIPGGVERAPGRAGVVGRAPEVREGSPKFGRGREGLTEVREKSGGVGRAPECQE